jgi:16S rRNA (guanine527-N7)-methyltransferase
MEVTKERLAAALQDVAAAFGAVFSDDIRRGLLTFASLLAQWNERINLTGARSADSIIAGHFPDAFALAERLAEPATVIDVGSGGGLPALPLALLRSGLRICLVEPTGKKVAFLHTAVRELGLEGRVRVDRRRVEAISGGDFQVAISRATFPPARWVEIGSRLVKAPGRVFVLTTPPIATELGMSRLMTYDRGRRAIAEVLVDERSDVPRGTSRPARTFVPRGTGPTQR